MKSRILLIGVLAGLGALAFASLITTLHAYGRGIVQNGEGKKARFELSARKVTHGDRTSVTGACVLDTSTNDVKGPRLSIRVVEMTVVEKQARVAGPAILSLPRPDGTYVHLSGRGVAEVVSNRHLGEVGDPDVLGVGFQREAGPTFNFGGKVVEGDATVGKSVSY